MIYDVEAEYYRRKEQIERQGRVLLRLVLGTIGFLVGLLAVLIFLLWRV